jgi:hypothetical protein
LLRIGKYVALVHFKFFVLEFIRAVLWAFPAPLSAVLEHCRDVTL